ncbi:MAG: hypothetical protein PHO12_09105, partial [Bacteroidales bacterium]|nr:hypothetical protein [Bacteroidales bacterium]
GGNLASFNEAASIDFYRPVASTGSEGEIRFNTNTGSSGSLQRMVIDRNGNVGVGITNPSYKLDVGADVNNRSMLRLSSGAANRMAAVTFWGNNAESGWVGYEGGSEIVPGGTAGDLIIRNVLSGKNINLITNGGNVGISTTTPAARLHVYGNGTTAAAFTNGSVGIGFTNPGVLLDVNGYFRATGATISSIGAGMIMADSSGNLYSTSTAIATGIPSPSGISGYTLRSNGTNWVANSALFNDGTNVGIGTTAPGYLLDIYKNGTGAVTQTAARLMYNRTDGGIFAGNGVSLDFNISGTLGPLEGTGRIAYVSEDAIGSNASLRFSTSKAANAVTIFNNGSVGIGTTNPSGRLHVGATTYSSVNSGYQFNIFGPMNIMQRDTQTDSYITNNAFFNSGSSWQRLITGGATMISSNSDAGVGGLAFLVAPSGVGGTTFTWTKAMIIDSAGNVGISTTTPTARLHVYGNGTTAAAFTNGSVGVGFTNPGVLLDVNGYLRATGATISSIGAGMIMADSSGNLYSTSTAIATGIPSPSGISGYTLRSNGTNWVANNLLFNDGTNVGIGTTNPVAKFTIGAGYPDLEYDGFRITNSPITLTAQSTANTFYRWLGGSYSQASTLNFDLANTIAKNKGVAGSGFRLTSGVGAGEGAVNGYFSISSLTGEIAETYTPTELMRITNTGNVGIGTTAPGAKLHVSDDTKSALKIGDTKVTTIGETNDGSYAGMLINPYNSTLNLGFDKANTKLAIWHSQANYSYLQQNASNFVITTYSNSYPLILQSAGGNVGISTTTPAARLHIYGNGTTAAAFTNGSVGVGFTNPGVLLDVNGYLRATGATISSIGAGMIMADSSGNLYSTSTLTSGWTVNGTEVYKTNTAGNVGIGTTTPSNNLNVYTTTNTGGITITGGVGATNASLIIKNNGSGGNSWDISSTGGAHGYGDGKLLIGVGFSPKMTIDGSGNVGVGTTAPTAKLHVAGTSYLNGQITTSLSGLGNRCIYVDASGNLLAKTTDCGTATGGDNLGDHIATKNIQLGNYWLSGDGGNEGVFVKSDGNVGVGTNAPNFALQLGTGVQASGWKELFIADVPSSGNGVQINLNNTGYNFGIGVNGTNFTIGQVRAAAGNGQTFYSNFLDIQQNGNVGIATTNPKGLLHVYSIASSTDALVVTNNGNVGIGKTNPGSNLDVLGTGALSGNISASGGTFNVLAGGGVRLVATDDSGNIYATSSSVATGIPSASGISGYTLRSNGTSWVANNLLFNDGTNVGIGTAAPNFKLEVRDVNSFFVRPNQPGSGDVPSGVLIGSVDNNLSLLSNILFGTAGNKIGLFY